MVLELNQKECCVLQYGFLQVKMLSSLLVICKTCSLQSYKYSFKSKGCIVAHTQSHGLSLKQRLSLSLRREQTLFFLSPSPQGSLTKTSRHHDNNKTSAVSNSPNKCRQFQHCKINSPCFTQEWKQHGRGLDFSDMDRQNCSSASLLAIWAWMEQETMLQSTKYFP